MPGPTSTSLRSQEIALRRRWVSNQIFERGGLVPQLRGTDHGGSGISV
jgi:hypothetical protein